MTEVNQSDLRRAVFGYLDNVVDLNAISSKKVRNDVEDIMHYPRDLLKTDPSHKQLLEALIAEYSMFLDTAANKPKKARKNAAKPESTTKPKEEKKPRKSAATEAASQIHYSAQGKFLTAESEKIWSGIEAAILDRGLEYSDLRMCTRDGGATQNVSKATMTTIWKEIYIQLPDRTPKSIYHHGQVLLAEKLNINKWSEDEKQNLRSLVKVHGSDWAAIGKLMMKSARKLTSY
jgi:hypothetical protein